MPLVLDQERGPQPGDTGGIRVRALGAVAPDPGCTDRVAGAKQRDLHVITSSGDVSLPGS